MLGYIIGLSTMNVAARYISLFLMACGYVGTYLFARVLPNPLPSNLLPRIRDELGLGFKRYTTTTSVSPYLRSPYIFWLIGLG